MGFFADINQFVFARTMMPHALARAKKVDSLLRAEKGVFLDFGCADCKVEGFIRNRKLRFVSFDYLLHELRSAKEKGFKRLLQADGTNTPFKDSSFDGCFSSEVFEHIKKDGLAAKEIFRVLKPGARAFILVPASELEKHFPKKLARAFYFIPSPAHGGSHAREGYTADSLNKLFEGAGFIAVTNGFTGRGMIAGLALNYYWLRLKEETTKKTCWRIARILFSRFCLLFSLFGLAPLLDSMGGGAGLDVYGVYEKPEGILSAKSR